MDELNYCIFVSHMGNISIKEFELTKVYYSIGEVAEIFDVNASLIRFWEKEFDIIKPKKNKKGNRLFTKQDVENYQLIFHFVKERGYTLKGAKEKLKGNKNDLTENHDLIKRLNHIKNFLLEIKKEL